MMKHLHILAAIMMVAALFGCRQHTSVMYDSTLEKLANKMDSTNWNRYCPKIEDIDMSSLHTKADSALYSLLAYANIKRSGRKAPPADSIIALAADFYADGREPRRAMMAWYFRACSNFDRERYADAVYYGLHMFPYANQLNDTLYLTRYYDLLGSCFQMVGNHLEKARAFTSGLKYYHANPKSGDGNYPYFMSNALMGWLEAEYPDSAMTIFKENIPHFLDDSLSITREGMKYLLWIYHTIVRMLPNVDYNQVTDIFDLLDSNPIAHSIIENDNVLRLEREYYNAVINRPELIDSLLFQLNAIGIDTFHLKHPLESHIFPDVVQAQRTYIIEQQEIKAAHDLKQNTLRTTIVCIIAILLLSIIGIWYHRHRIARKEDEFSARIDEVRALYKEIETSSIIDKNNSQRLQSLTNKLFTQRLSEINELCDTYYNTRDIGERAKSIFYREFEDKMSNLATPDSLSEIEQMVNECKDNLVSSLRQELPQLKESEINFLTYIYAGFAARAVCLFMGISKDNYYMRRRRIKARIASFDTPSRQRFIDEMGN